MSARRDAKGDGVPELAVSGIVYSTGSLDLHSRQYCFCIQTDRNSGMSKTEETAGWDVIGARIVDQSRCRGLTQVSDHPPNRFDVSLKAKDIFAQLVPFD